MRLLFYLVLSSSLFANNFISFDMNKKIEFKKSASKSDQLKSIIVKELFEKGIDYKNLELVLVGESKSLIANHFKYHVAIDNIIVDGVEVNASIDKLGNLFRVSSSASELTHLIKENNKKKNLNTLPLISSQQAFKKAWDALRADEGLVFLPKSDIRYIVKNNEMKLAYIVNMSTVEPYGHWKVIISANDNIVLDISEEVSPTKMRTLKRRKTNKKRMSFENALENLKEKKNKKALTKMMKLFKAAKGNARVFDPNPNTSLDDERLRSSSPESSFQAAYQDVELKNLTKQANTYHLKNNNFELDDFDYPHTKASTTSDGNWIFSRKERNSFLDAMTYYHLDKSMSYLEEIGFTGSKKVFKKLLLVDSNGARGQDNSYFSPSQNALSFGHGCVPDNEDADVILHELGHAIQGNIVGSSWSGGDTGAMGEGFGDYWAASYSYTTPNGKLFHPEWVFKWDGHNQCWNGRSVDNQSMKYRHSHTYRAHGGPSGREHDELWGTALFQAFKELYDSGVKRESIDQIIIESHFGIGRNLKMRDMANIIVKTAKMMFPQEKYADAFEFHFRKSNILE